MTKVSNQRAKRIVVGLTLLFFALGYSLVFKAGIADIWNLLSFLVASYLVVWGGHALISPIPKDEIRIRFVLMATPRRRFL